MADLLKPSETVTEDQTQRRLAVHENIDEKNLHGVQRVAQSEEGTQRDESQRSNCSTELEGKEILNIMEDRFPCKHPVSYGLHSIKDWANTFFDCRQNRCEIIIY